MTVESFGKRELEWIARGGCLLGSGGGGTLESAWNLVQHFESSDYYGSQVPFFKTISLEKALEKGGYGVVVAYLGAPEALKYANYPEAVVNAVEWIRQELEKDNTGLAPDQQKFLRYIVPAETGALSSVVPCLVSSKLGLEVLDADGAGRAVPELPMLTYAAAGIPVNPLVLANGEGYAVRLAVRNAETGISEAEAAENLARALVGLDVFHQIAGLAVWLMGPEDMAKAVQITGTLTEALEIGKVLEEKDAEGILACLNAGCAVGEERAFRIFEGVFFPEGCSTDMAGGFDRGTIAIRNSQNEVFTGIFQNETLLAWKSSSSDPLAMAPDSIAYYVEDGQKVYSNGDVLGADGRLVERLKGKEVSVIGIAARDPLRQTDAESGLMGSPSDQGSILRSFKKALLSLGYAGRYVKIEDIWGKIE
ncbi:DUF917 family protein [Desulfobotulus sp.]|jgi:DUF917 family protein|uniref:S-methyl thiohydantoin desulfurase domain-containing protein n=1 Tax=Desulfobotulus sp. TaxID=1940337 RepID=UPI002A371BF1|nr:DUF917 family protein [Desulfobotulus sp.]MDY0161954.1 DUF917 family protein [Desulfobotulus sp.]